ncbi:MAG: cytochrome P450 [Actinobacteria bacterium]|jgi:cytochrome P450|nr:cytochrome P450 [Actinomycetota bacterium]
MSAISPESLITESLESGDYYKNPYPLFAELRANNPIHFSNTIGGWVLTRYREVDLVLRDHENYSSKGRVTHLLNQLSSEAQAKIKLLHAHFAIGLAHSDAPEHRRIRSLLAQSFTPKIIDSLRPEITTQAQSLVAKLEGDIDLIAELLTPLPALIVGKLLGSKPTDLPNLIRWAHAVNGLYERGGKISEEKALHAEAMLREMRDFVLELVSERRALKQADKLESADVLSNLVLQEEESLTDQELLSTVVTLFVAGHETTTHLLGNGILALLLRQDVLNEARKDETKIPLIVEEMARFDGSVPRSWRLAKSDLELSGVQIKKGDLVLPILAAANRDPEVFEDPDKFDLHRENKRHLAYGKGVHVCLGAPLARLEAQELLKALFQRFSHIELNADAQSLEWRKDLALRGLLSLPVRLN